MKKINMLLVRSVLRLDKIRMSLADVGGDRMASVAGNLFVYLAPAASQCSNLGGKNV